MDSVLAPLLHPNTWHITRAAGVLAYLCLWLANCSGLLLATRLPRQAVVPALLANVHQWAAAWALYATTVHIVVLLFDTWVPYSLSALFIPFLSPYRPTAVALGVVGLYLVLGTQLTTYGRRRFSERVWRLAHQASVPAFVLIWLHGVLAGSDASVPWLVAVYWFTGGTFLLTLTARLKLRGILVAHPGRRG